ncbi:MAG: M48 family metalloprotease, partial [Lentisphaeria bacterium]|nr:M48 family metalloprotease [Lentisphaeria bacterium]
MSLVVSCVVAGVELTTRALDQKVIPEAIAYGSGGALCFIVFLFMIKPFLIIFRPRPEPHVVSTDDAPELFAFVERICTVLQAPIPSRIYLTTEVNASVTCRHGLLSLFRNDFVLSIGLPLVHGLDLRELAGVIAHECGHFAQATGHRVSYIVISLSNWFWRVVHDRDIFDLTLREWSRNVRILMPLFIIVFFFIGLPRLILRCLMYMGYLVGCFFIRQMEYDADRYEALISGSKRFETTKWRIALLGTAYDLSIAGLDQAFKDGRLGDNLPVLVATNEKLLKVDDRKRIRNAIYQPKPDEYSRTFADLVDVLFNTHPSDLRRIKSVRKIAAEGLFHLDGPSTVLFDNLESHGREVTTKYYKFVLKKRFKRAKVVDSEQIVRQLEEIIDAGDALDRCFQYAVSFYHPYTISNRKPETDRPMAEQIRLLQAAREQMEFRTQAAQSAMKRFDQAQTWRQNANLAASMLRVNITNEARRLLRMQIDKVTIATMLREADKDTRMVMEILDSFRDQATTRFNLALQLLNYDEFRQDFSDAEKCTTQADDLLVAQRQIAACHGDIDNLAGSSYIWYALTKFRSEPSQRMIAFLMSTSERTDFTLHKVHHQLSEVAYPFEHESGRISIGPYVLENMPERDDYMGLLAGANEMYDKTIGLYYRIVGQIASIVQKIE